MYTTECGRFKIMNRMSVQSRENTKIVTLKRKNLKQIWREETVLNEEGIEAVQDRKFKKRTWPLLDPITLQVYGDVIVMS